MYVCKYNCKVSYILQKKESRRLRPVVSSRLFLMMIPLTLDIIVSVFIMDHKLSV